jgi:cysteine desulfurase/selenocysteine lyase
LFIAKNCIEVLRYAQDDRKMTFDVAAVRRQFPILSEIIDGRPVHYLDNGASAQTPLAVIDAVRSYELTSRANVLRGVHRLAERATELYETARTDVAKFLGVQPMEIIFTGGCTAAINLVAYSYGQLLKPGDRILLSELEHHSNIVPWQLLRQRSGVELDMIPVTTDGQIDLGLLSKLVTPKTKLISLAHVSNVTGALLDVRKVVEAAKSVGARVMLDGAQRAPHGPIDLKALGIDFYVFAGHKAYGPNGVGVLWAKPELLEAMPPFHGGGSMIGRVTFAETTWAPPPRRFEAGTPPIGPAIGLGTACTWMAALDWTATHDHEMGLVQRVLDGLQEIDGTQILGPASLQNR